MSDWTGPVSDSHWSRPKLRPEAQIESCEVIGLITAAPGAERQSRKHPVDDEPAGDQRRLLQRTLSLRRRKRNVPAMIAPKSAPEIGVPIMTMYHAARRDTMPSNTLTFELAFNLLPATVSGNPQPTFPPAA